MKQKKRSEAVRKKGGIFRRCVAGILAGAVALSGSAFGGPEASAATGGWRVYSDKNFHSGSNIGSQSGPVTLKWDGSTVFSGGSLSFDYTSSLMGKLAKGDVFSKGGYVYKGAAISDRYDQTPNSTEFKLYHDAATAVSKQDVGNAYRLQPIMVKSYSYDYNYSGGGTSTVANDISFSDGSAYYTLDTSANQEMFSHDPSRQGYTFAGWYTSPDGGARVSSYSTDNQATLYAHWTANSYNLSAINGPGINSVSGSGSYQHGSSVTVSASVSAGHHFTGWSGTYSSGANPYTFAMPAGNVTLTANAEPNTHSLTFVVDGNVVSSNGSVPYGAKLSDYVPSVSGKPGYAFSGWSNMPDCMPDHNVTVSATWQVRSYVVTCIDRCGNTVIGTKVWESDYGELADGGRLGTNTKKIGEYHDGYRLVDWTRATVGENGATVYRNFKKYEHMSGITLSDDFSTVLKADPDITSVRITREDGIARIADHAFEGCGKLASVVFDNKTVVNIGANAFKDCNNAGLTKVVLPYSTREIGDQAFAGCSNLKKITVKNTGCSFGEGSIPTFIDIAGFSGSSAEQYCKENSKGMTEITDICDGFFEYEELTEFVVPDNVTNIGANAFRSCERLESVSLGSSVAEIGSKAFQNTAISSIVIPASVTAIYGREAFADTKLRKVTFSENSRCAFIGDATFARCPLEYYRNPVPERGQDIDADLENGVNEVKTEVFFVPASVNIVNASAFTGCGQVGQISFLGMQTEISGKNDIPAGTAIGCYEGSKAYAFAKRHHYPIALFVGYEADGTKDMENGKHAGDGDIVSVGIGPKLKSIGDCAFEGCSSLRAASVGIGDAAGHALESIGSRAFNGCSELETVKLPKNNGLARIGESAFAGCSHLESIVIHNPNCELKNDGTTFDADIALGGWSKSTASDYANTYGHSFISQGTSYQIIFNKNGGKDGTDKVYVCGSMTLPEIKVPSYAGRTFAGYFAGGVQYYDQDGRCVLESQVALKDDLMGDDAPSASWTLNEYRISYDGNAGSGSMGSTGPIKYDSNYKLDANTYSRAGYAFDGWNTEPDGSGTNYGDQETVKNLAETDGEVVTLYAQWNPIRYSVVFSENGGSVKCAERIDMAYDEDSELPEYHGEKENYRFGGWNTEADGSGSNFEAGKPARNIVSEPGVVTLYARWIPIEYAIEYDLAGGRLKDGRENPASYHVDTETFTLENPLKRGYEFMGWSGTGIVGVSKKVTVQKGTIGKRNYTAHWGDKVDYSISYDLDGGRLKDGKENPSHYDVDTKTFTLSNPAKKGFLFVGWRLDDEEEASYTVTIEEGSYGNRTYTAVWKAGVYDVTLHLNGGSYAEGERELTEYAYGSAVKMPTNMNKKGHAFLGWSTRPDSNAADVKAIGIGEEGDKEYYAVWEQRSDKTISISYKDADGSDISVPDKYTRASYIDNVNDVVPLPSYTEVEKEGCVFIGWYDNPEHEGDAYSEFVFDGTRDGMVFYASWSSDRYAISYETAGGVIEGDAPDFYYFGQKTGLPRNVVKDGFNFMGWYDNPDFSGEPTAYVSPGAKGDKTYYALLSRDAYRIIYYTNGGQIGNDNVTEYRYGESARLPLDVERNGCTFLGWYDTKDFSGDIVTEIPKGSVGNRTYYAKWAPKTYKITYVENGGKIIGNHATSFTYNKEEMLPKDVKRENYTFAGWYDNEDLKGEAVASVSPDDYGNKTYFAKWEPNKFKVSLVLNGGLLAEQYQVGSYSFGDRTVLPIPVKEGYAFAGWHVNSNLTGTKVAAIGPDEYGDKVFYAKWTGGVKGSIGEIGEGAAGRHSTIKKTISKPKVVTVGKVKYVLTSNKAKAIGVKSKKYKRITIPATIKKNGKKYKVCAIKAGALKKMKRLKKVIIGKNVTVIGRGAFASDKRLKSIVIKSRKLKLVGSRAFKGMQKKAVIRVPKGRRAAYRKMLKKKGLKPGMDVK